MDGSIIYRDRYPVDATERLNALFLCVPVPVLLVSVLYQLTPAPLAVEQPPSIFVALVRGADANSIR